MKFLLYTLGINTDGLIVRILRVRARAHLHEYGAGQEQPGVAVFYGVNNAGQVVATNGDSKAVLYENGTYTVIPELSGVQFSSSAATSINNAGEVVGISKKLTGSGNYLLWTYSNGAYQPLPVEPDNCNGISTCYGGAPNAYINNTGQVIWTSTTPDTQPVLTPFFIEADSVMDLNSLISADDPNAPFVNRYLKLKDNDNRLDCGNRHRQPHTGHGRLPPHTSDAFCSDAALAGSGKRNRGYHIRLDGPIRV